MKQFLFFSFLILTGCTTQIRETQPSSTATQQYLIAQSALNASQQIKITNPGILGKVYIDTSNFDGTKYTISVIEDALLNNGVAITLDQTKADTIMSIREGVQSIDNRVTQMGVPAIPLPTFIPGIALATPSVPFIEKDQNVGITLIGLVAWNAKTGKIIENLGEKIGISFNTIWSGVIGTTEHNDFDNKTKPN